MNYVGSISILDRGDAPAQAVIDRNARSLAQRVADETKEELAKVLDRVENIYGNFELSENLLESNRTASLEYIQDLGELEDILQDQVKKKKYQQQVTIFIVGFENTSGQKLRLLQQVNEFFVDNANAFEEDDMFLASPDLDLEDMEEVVEGTLRQTESLAQKLVDLKKGLDDHMHNLTQMKASNKAKKTKELEKDLNQARKQLDAVNTSLLDLSKEVREKSEKIDQLQRDIEKRNVDVLRYKRMAEDAKKSGDSDKLKEELSARDDQIRTLKMEIERLKVEVGRENEQREETLKDLGIQKENQETKIRQLEYALEEQETETTEAKLVDQPKRSNKSELQRLHEEEIQALQEHHLKEVTQIQTQHSEEIRSLLSDTDTEDDSLGYDDDCDSSDTSSQGTSTTPKELTSEPGDRSRPITKEASRLSRQGSQERQDTKGSSRKSDASKPSSRQNKSRSSNKTTKEGSYVVDDDAGEEGGEGAPQKPPARSNLKARSNLEPVQETTHEFEDEFDLKDEPTWSRQPQEHLPGRFLQYRQLTRKKLEELEHSIDNTVKITGRKINTLKAQFQEHKSKWETERELLISHIDQAQDLQTDAEKEADIAINQLEDIINDQEELEKDDEAKRVSLENHEREASLTLAEAEENLRLTLEDQAKAEDKLLLQTDDAKAELTRKTSRLSEVSVTSEPTEDPAAPSPDKLLQGDDPLSRASGRSKSSLRERRQLLSSLKASAEERRARSPSVYSIKSHRSVLSDAELDENGDMPFPPDETKEERETRLSLHDMATSPMPFTRDKTSDSTFSKKGIPMSEHPVVQEFIKTYNSVLQFKSGLSHAFSDRDMPSLSYILNEIEPVEFTAESRVQPQLEDMQKNVTSILEEVMVLLTNLISSERDYPVSSLLGITSKEPTRAALFTRETAQDRPKSRLTQPSAVSKASSTKEHLKEIQDQYIGLQRNFEENNRKHEEQLNHNTVVMMEMQDTINALQRELSNIGQQAGDTSDRQTDTIADAPVMFTRLDSERNAKIMKRAVNEERLDPQKYEEALETMDKYTSLPAKRLTHLVQKYVHHVHMKEVEENVRNQDNLDEEVFHILDKMEVLQNERAKRWATHMDEMGEQRQHLVGEMMMTLDDIEKESGVFLIKPMYSYKSNYNLNKYQGKLSRANRPVPKDGTVHSRAASAYVPVPTPASNVRPSRSRQGDVTVGIRAPVSNPEDGVEGQMSTLLGEHPRPVWNPSISTGAQDPKRFIATLPGQINTPRILELDINRMLIGQNQVSQRIGQNLLTNDRLSNAANTTTRSYITVNRPSGQTNQSDRPRSHTGISEAPPATPLLRENTPSKFDRSQTLGSTNTPPSGSHTPSGSYSAGSKRVRIHSDHIQSPRASPPAAHAFSATSPLPPIGSTEVPQEISEPPLPPASPPGSSLRLTPAYPSYGAETPAQA